MGSGGFRAWGFFGPWGVGFRGEVAAWLFWLLGAQGLEFRDLGLSFQAQVGAI